MTIPHNAVMRFVTAPDGSDLLLLWKSAAGAAVEFLREHAANGEQLLLAAVELDGWLMDTISMMPDGWRRDSMERMRQAIVAAVFQSLQREFLPEQVAPILDAQIPRLAEIVRTGDIEALKEYVIADRALRAMAVESNERRESKKKRQAAVNSVNAKRKAKAEKERAKIYDEYLVNRRNHFTWNENVRALMRKFQASKNTVETAIKAGKAPPKH